MQENSTMADDEEHGKMIKEGKGKISKEEAKLKKTVEAASVEGDEEERTDLVDDEDKKILDETMPKLYNFMDMDIPINFFYVVLLRLF